MTDDAPAAPAAPDPVLVGLVEQYDEAIRKLYDFDHWEELQFGKHVDTASELDRRQIAHDEAVSALLAYWPAVDGSLVAVDRGDLDTVLHLLGHMMLPEEVQEAWERLDRQRCTKAGLGGEGAPE